MQLFRQFPNGLAEARADDQTGSDIVRVMRKKHDPCGSEAQQADPKSVASLTSVQDALEDPPRPRSARKATGLLISRRPSE